MTPTPKWNKPTFEDWKNISKYSNFIAEPKMDGMRCYAVMDNGVLRLERYGGSIKTLQFPEIMNSLDIPNGTILDGEICIKRNEFETDFQAISQRMNLTDTSRIKYLSKDDPAQFVAFDILQLEGENISSLSLSARKKYLEDIRLFDPDEYPIRYPDCDINLADINGDGSIDALDIEPFLDLLFP